MISVIFPILNENPEFIDKTIKSVLDTSPSDVEIIAVDDHSDIEPQFEYKNKVIFERNKFRMGTSASRHVGACLSSKKHFFLTDSHVLFQQGWYEEVLKSLENNPQSLYCGICLGLTERNFNLATYAGRYCGARLFLHEEDQILDGKWIAEQEPNEYEISCVMGANYFINRDWFFKIRGMSDMKMWGSDEPCLSLKTWLAGGNVKINKNVVIGHMFRDATPYSTQIKYLIYNKIRMCKTLLDDKLSSVLLSKLPHDKIFNEAENLIKRENVIIEEYKKYYQSIFVKDINWLCQKFSIEIPN